jgi:putative protease
MSKIKIKPELLSPAGSAEAARAAFKAGADAVYIGGSRFGARAYADNPEEDELLDLIDLAHFLGKRLYLTVNTLQKNDELEEQLADFLEPFYRRGLDGVIVQDLGVVDLLRRVFPSLPIHASTQMAVTGYAGAKLLAEKGITRVVPARELTLPEIRQIREKADVEVECFIHGAMCYSYSGMCLMSSMIGGRSGNRGRCAGICRMPFEVLDEEGRAISSDRTVSEKNRGKNRRDEKPSKYPLNMKDMCALPILPELIDAGISSFKIEGRMKRPEYTAGVTKIYRENIDRYLEDPEGYSMDPADMGRLSLLFSRDGFSCGYYHTKGSRGMIAVNNRRIYDPAVRSSQKVQDLYREISENLSGTELKVPCEGTFEISAGEPASLTLRSDGAEISVGGDIVQTAKNRPMTDEQIAKPVSRFGNSPFCLTKLSIRRNSGEDLFIPVGSLNRLRREAAAKLEENLRKKFERGDMNREAACGRPDHSGSFAVSSPGENIPDRERIRETRCNGVAVPLWVSVITEEQLRAVRKHERIVSGVCLPLSLAERCGSLSLPVRFVLPWIVRSDRYDELDRRLSVLEKSDFQEDGILVRSLDGLGFLKMTGREKSAVAGGAVYTMNNRACRFVRELGPSRDIIPLELNAGEIRHRDNRRSEMILYGSAPMMISAGCVLRTMGVCDHSFRTVSIRDRRGARFPVRCVCDECMNVIYNSLPMSLFDDLDTVRKAEAASWQISFTNETEERADEVLSAFEAASCGREVKLSFPVTHGHFRRGVL